MTGMQGSVEGLINTTCPPGVAGNGFVGIQDFLSLLAAWGPNPKNAADLDGDGVPGIFCRLRHIEKRVRGVIWQSRSLRARLGSIRLHWNRHKQSPHEPRTTRKSVIPMTRS